MWASSDDSSSSPTARSSPQKTAVLLVSQPVDVLLVF